jgi:hypothetical protein
MHEFGNKNYESVFMKIDDGKYISAETTLVLALNDTTDLMNKQTDYSHPLVQWMHYPSTQAHGGYKRCSSYVYYWNCGPLGSPPWNESSVPQPRTIFYSTCLVRFDLDAFEGVSSKVRSGRYLGNNSIFFGDPERHVQHHRHD